MRWSLWAEQLSLDARLAVRRLAGNPAFAGVACLSLALGIGANTAAFSVVHAVLLRSLPVQDPDALVVVATRNAGSKYSLSYPAYTYLRDHTSSLGGLVAFRALPLNVGIGPATERVTGMLVSGNYFDVLGVTVHVGTAIAPSDDVTPGVGGARGLVAVVSHSFWVRRLNADPRAVGRAIRVDGHPATIAGVAPAQFHGTRVGSLPDIFVPMMFAEAAFESRTWLTNPRNLWLRIIGRVQPGTTVARTEAGMTAAFHQFNQQFIAPLATTDAARRRALQAAIVLEDGATGLLETADTVKPPLLSLMGLVGVVLLIACVNVANLLVANAERRHRETAISVALGATGARLWRQHLIESFAIGASGLAFGLLLASWMRDLLVDLLPAGRQEVDTSMDPEVLGMSALAGAVIAVGLASVTAWQTSRLGIMRALKGEDLATRLRLRQGLIVGQLALSIVVLAAAALFGETISRLRLVDPGFERTRVLIASVAPRGYSPERRRAFYERLLEDVRSIPGVVSAALANEEPLAVNTGWNIVRRDAAGAPQQASATIAFVSPDYFRTMGIPLVRGRDFDARDATEPVPRVIVNENFAKTYVTGENPVGARITGNGTMTFEIVGVVKDSASTGLRDLDQQVMYVPGGHGVLHVRTAVPPAAVASAVEAAVRRLDADVPVFNVRTIDQQLERFMLSERTFAALSSTFGVLALVLSGVGLYGVIAHGVSRRTRELGIRLALGATPRRIVHLVLGEAGRLILFGLIVGLPCALVVARSIRGLLYGVQPGEWTTLVIPVGVLVIVAAIAAWVPARRAARVDPLLALRAE